MNTMRSVILATLTSLAFAPIVAAAPERYGPRGTIPREGQVQQQPQRCGPVLKRSTSGPRARDEIVNNLGPCAPSSKMRPGRRAGPRQN